MARDQIFPLNTLGLSHQFMAAHIRPGQFCIDATAGKGRDTVFLCGLVGKTGRVLAFDIQADAVLQTKQRVEADGYSEVATVLLAGHETMAAYAQKESIDGIMFNLGWLPGGNHRVFSQPQTTIHAIRDGLSLLKPGGVMSICIYHGKETGTAERDALLPFFKTLDAKCYTVMTVEFSNRTGEIPIPVFIVKEKAT